MKKFYVLIGLIVLLAGGVAFTWWIFSGEPQKISKPPEEQPLPRENVKLYFFNEKGRTLVQIKRSLPGVSSRAERIHQIVRQLLVPPEKGGVIAILPENLKLRSVFINSRTVYLDFNEKLVGAAQGTTEEMFLLYSIVNSVLANLPDEYKLVHFLVNGETRKTIGSYGEESGHIAIKFPLGPRWNLVEPLQ